MWWAVAYGPVNQEPAWVVAYGSQASITARYPGAVMYSFTSRSQAQAYVNAQTGKKNKRVAKRNKVKEPRSPNGALIVTLARSWEGVPYLYGGTTRKGVDCSGLILNVCREAGVFTCPRTSEEQWAWCVHIPASEAGAGDLVFFVGAEIDPPPGHVGILVAPGVMIDAPTTGEVV